MTHGFQFMGQEKLRQHRSSFRNTRRSALRQGVGSMKPIAKQAFRNDLDWKAVTQPQKKIMVMNITKTPERPNQINYFTAENDV